MLRLYFLVFCGSLILNSSYSQIGGPGGIGNNSPQFNMDKFIQKVTAHFQNANEPIAGYQLVFNKDGQLYYQESGGNAIYAADSNNAENVPMTNNTRQNISSVSKFITTLVLANVLDEYDIYWNEPVSAYLHSTWVVNMAPEHSDPNSPCYLTFEKLVRHQSCLDFNSTSSGPNPSNTDMQAFLSSESLNTNVIEDYRNGNFTLARILLSNIITLNNPDTIFSLDSLVSPNHLTSNYSAQVYYEAIKNYIYTPLGINAPADTAAIQAFHNSNVAPRAHQFPFNENADLCFPSTPENGGLGWKARNPAHPHSAGGTGLALSTLELAEIVAFFKNDNTETIISNSQRDTILDYYLGVTLQSQEDTQTPFGNFYYKNGTRGPGCPGGNAADSLQRATKSYIAMYPNNVELVMLTNSNIDFRFDSANEWQNCWETDCSSFTHVTAQGSVLLNRSKIDNVSLNNSPNQLLFIAHDFTRSQQISPAPVAAYYEDNKWWVMNEDGSNMSTGKRFNVLAFEENYPLAFKHAHIPNVNGAAPHVSVIDHPELNGNPDAKLLVTQNFGGPGGVLNNHSIGVWYNGSNWTIFNQDFSPMVANAKFNVLFNHSQLFTENISAPFGSFFGISAADLPDQDDSQLLFTSNALSPNGQFNNSEVGVWFTNNQWFLYNENGNFFLGGAKMSVLKLEECECCGENPGLFSNLTFDWCANSNYANCLSSIDSVNCAEDFVFFDPVVYDQCRTYLPTFDEIFQDFTLEGFPRITTHFDISYFDINTGDSFTTIVLDTIPPTLLNVPNDTVVNCSIPPYPEVIASTDNCTINISPDFQEVIEGADCNFKITRIYTAIDSAGNQSTSSYCIYSGTYADQDNDGFNILEDCNDENPTIYPGANELCDGFDNDCDNQIDENCMDCIAANFLNIPSGLNSDQSLNGGTATQLKWNHYSDASDGCIIQGALSDGMNQTGTFGNILIQGLGVIGDNEGNDFSGVLGPNSSYTLFNPSTFPSGNTASLVPGATYMWRVRCGCIIDLSIPLPGRLDLNNLHLSPWSAFEFFDNLNSPISNNFNSNDSHLKMNVDQEKFHIFPNPSKGTIEINANTLDKEFLIEVFEIQGRLIHSSRHSILPRQIRLDQFSNGLHLIRLTSATERKVQKILLEK